MITRALIAFLIVLCNIISVTPVLQESLQLDNLRYNDCGRYKCPENGKFKFATSTMYQYLYTVSINSTFNKTNSPNSELNLKFKVEMRIENCEGVMRLGRHKPKEGFDVFEETGFDKIYEDVRKHDLRFSFYDGYILNVCPNEVESISSLNIKKGILSAFQNKMKRFDINKFTTEKDVNGLCPTGYSLERINGTQMVIRKIKDINNCQERYQLHSIIPTSRYVLQSKFHKWAPLNSTMVCHQTINASILTHILCHEEHMLKLLPNRTYSSRTLITQEFQLVSETPTYFFSSLTYPDDITIREDLAFNHKKPKKSENSELEESEILLQKLCETTSDEFQLDAAGAFTKFVHTARHLSYDALEMLLEKSSELCSTGKKHVQDSLPFLRSTAAVSLMKEIIIHGNLSETTANGWLFAMSLFSRPDAEVINSVTPLLFEETASNSVLLSITSVIHSYGLWANENEDKETILMAISFLESSVNETLSRHGHNFPEKLIVLLKSLGNAGVLTENTGYTLSTCIFNTSLPADVRIAAIEAHRRLPCGYNLDTLLDVYTDAEIEAEVRVAAYLQLMNCPAYGTIKKIKTTLENESVNQVGSFVWSHIQNVMTSSLEYRIEIQSILQDYYLQKKFKADFRKFSRNYEKAFYLSDYGIGGVVVSNIIFSTKTYIPTYITFNVTINVFGEIVNVLEVNVFLDGFEKYVEKLFKVGAEDFIKNVEKKLSSFRFYRSIPTTIKEKIKSLASNFIGGLSEPALSLGFKLFGNEIKYYSYRGEEGVNKLIDNFDINNIIDEFLNGQEIKFDYSTVFMDISYVSPTGAGVPLNLDAVGIAITNFDSSVLMNVKNFSSSRQMLVDGKLRPKFSVNFEGAMGTDLVYEQSQVQMKSKIYTSSELEGYFLMNGYDNVSLSFNLPQKKFDIFNFESSLHYKDNDEHKDVMLADNSLSPNRATCFWPLFDQAFGLKICSTYALQNTTNSTIMLQSLLDTLREPFKFSLFVEKSDPSAKIYTFKYTKKTVKTNESDISFEFETPESEIPRSMKMSLYLTPVNNNLTIIMHANRSVLEAQGFYKYTSAEKTLNFNVDINGLKHVNLILELHMKQDKRTTVYTPKLYFEITSKPVAELSGTYRWVEKKGTAQCVIDLQFKTNKFDSNVTGSITVSDHSAITSNVHIRYKFEKGKSESLNFEFKYNDRSTKLSKAVLGNFQLESTSYPEINMMIATKYQTSHDRIDARLEYVSSPFEDDESKKLNLQFVFSYYKTFNSLKLNTYVEIRKAIADVNVKLGLSHQNTPTGSNTEALVRYAKDKDIVVKLAIYTPQSIRFHYELRLNVTLPTGLRPMIVHVRIFEKYERDYNVDFSGIWFSGHTATAQGMFEDRSNHYTSNYNIKLLVKSRLFDEILLSAKITFSEQEHKITISADHHKIKYGCLLRHVTNNENLHETYVEYTYNATAMYYLSNRLDLKKKEVFLELHLDKFRDIHVAAKSTLQRWNSDVGVEFKWDVNRDPSQKIVVNFNTKSIVYSDRSQYVAKFIFEYPGHVSVASFILQNRGNYHSVSLALEMNPTSVIELMAYSENELFTKGFTRIGFKLLTPFENWKESAFFYGFYTEKQSFQTNGSLVWQKDQQIMFDTHGGYQFEDSINSVTLSSSLNSTLQDLATLAFAVNYTSVENEIHLGFLLQPNLKYSLFVSTSGMVKYYDEATEYIFLLQSRTPFLEHADTKLNSRLKLMNESRINGDVNFLLNNDLYALHLKGILNFFEKIKLCLHATTPYEKYRDVSGLLSYDPEEKHIALDLNSVHLNVKTDFIYVYNNLSNFNVKLEVVTPMGYLSNLIIVAMYKGNALELRLGWNTFNVGFAGITHFQAWTDLEYGVRLYTPIETFKQSNAIFKIFTTSDRKMVTARVELSNITKVGVNFEYNSEKSKIKYLDECDNYYDKDTPGIVKSVVLYNARVELDTLIYPTILGTYYVRQSDTRYTLDAELAVFFLKLNLWDQLEYQNMTFFNNSLKLTSSIDMFSEITHYVVVKKINEGLTSVNVDMAMTSFDQKLEGWIDVYYEYKPIDGSFTQIKNKIDGIHNVALKISTPFDLLESGEINIETQIQNYVFQTVVNVITARTNISLTGNLTYAENYFDLGAKFNMTSDYATLPAFQLKLLRDFSRLEKEILFSFKESNENGIDFADMFCIHSMWYIDSRNYITLSGELKSPFKILDELKASLHYSHEIETETYYLEAYMKYSNKTEMKARANLMSPNVTLNLESSMEGLRNAHFVGTLERISAGQQKIDAVMLTNSNFRIQGTSSVTDLTPFAIKGKLLKGKEGVEISSVEMHVKKKAGGYSVLASLYSKGKTLDVETEITDHENNTRIINLVIKTGKGTVESLQVNAELKLQHPGIYVLTVKGDSAVDDVRGSSITQIDIWFRNGIGAIFASLESATLKGKGEIFTVWKPPYHIYGRSTIHFFMEKKLKEIFNAKLLFMKLAKSFDNVTAGLLINLNKKWMMEANFTATLNSTNDRKVVSYLVLPNTNKYSIIGGLKYSDTYDLIQHVLLYSRPKDTPCYTVSDIDAASKDIKGLFAFKCGIKDSLFLMDKFHGQKTSNKLVLQNALKSNTLADILTTNVDYAKPNDSHILNLQFYYPPTKRIAVTNVNFQSTSNFDCFVNTTTPFANMPYFASEVKSETTPNLYQRFGKVYLKDRPALINITHVKTNRSRSILNDGWLIVEFPVATWHEGTMTYTYEDTFVNIVGSTEIFYNKERIINGTFTRKTTRTRYHDEYFTHLAIGNNFIPVGVNYIRQISNRNLLRSSYDSKRMDVYKLLNPLAFNLSGEMLVENFIPQEWTTFKVLYFNRSVVLKSRTDSGNPYENRVFVKLKPELWFNCNLKTNRTITNSEYQKLFDLNLAYPRRNYSLGGDFGYGENYLTSQVTLRNHLLKPSRVIGLTFHTNKPSSNLRETFVELFHPSFEKNVTMMTSFYSTPTIVADAKVDLEYSTDEKKKLQLSCVIEDKSKKGNRNYTWFLHGDHPKTKFNLNISGALRSHTGIHFVGNNISYRRSYLEQFWRGRAFLNTKENTLDVERISTSAVLQIHGDYVKRETIHILNALVVEGSNTNVSSYVEVDLYNKIVNALINLTKDSSDRLQIEGNMKENRDGKFNIWRTYNDFNFPQMTFYVALNHSRFLSSALIWRTDMGVNIMKGIRSTVSGVWISAQDAIEFWTQYLRSQTSEALTAIWNDAKTEIEEFLNDLGSIKTIQENINYFQTVFNDTYNANEFFLRDIHEFYIVLTHEISFVDKIGSLPKLVSEIAAAMGGTGEVIKKSLIWVVDTIKEFYVELLRVLDDLVEGKAEMYIAKYVKKGTEKFDNFVKDLHISFISSTETAMNEILLVLEHYRNKIMTIFEPTFIELVHHIDTTLWATVRKLVDFVYAKKDDLMNSPYFLRNANFTNRLDAIYKDFAKNDVITNVKKYVGLLCNAVYEYYISQIPYREELGSIGNEIIGEIKELYNLPFVAYTVDNFKLMYNQIVWLYEYFEVTEKIQKLIPFLYRQYQENSYTAMEIELKNHKPKTKLIFVPENGIIKLEQKLPFPWHAFNETPIYEELEEYKYLKKIQSFVSTSKVKLWSVYNMLANFIDPQSWLPPFKGHAQIIGFDNYITFDSRHVPFHGNYCKYLLSHDFMGDEFSLVLNSDEMDSQDRQSISLLTGGETITVQFTPLRITIDSRNIAKFPLQLNNTFIYFDNDIVTVTNTNGVTLECNVYYRVCTIHLSGWFFGKVSGLLGTMNNEQNDDVVVYNDKYGHSKREYVLWSLSQERTTCPSTTSNSMVPPDIGVNEKCSELFLNTTSPFEPCFAEVNPSSYYDSCVIHIENEHVCSTAMAYVQSCILNSIPLRIPALCVKCSTFDDEFQSEGSFQHLEGDLVPKSSDVVFIVEAKACNRDLLTKKHIQQLIGNLSKEFANNGFTHNRYALVVFGGDGIYKNPHSVTVDGNVFTDATNFVKYFENFPTGNGNSDIFDALRFAAKLSLRMAVSKTFVLIPCTNCDPTNMTLDYSVLHHAMIEKSITLHILMNEDFLTEKTKSGKVLFGLDSYTAYTKDDFKYLKGSLEVRKQTKLTKSLLGYCTPLALESNGTLFSARILSRAATNLVPKFISTFVKRVVMTAKPDNCQVCECHSDKNGVPYVECISCSFPTPVNFDFGLEDENDFSAVLGLESPAGNSSKP